MDYFDELETRSPEARETELMAALTGQIAHAKAAAPAYATILADVETAAETDRDSHDAMPVTRKT